MKVIILHMLILSCLPSFAGSEITFTAFEINTPEKISEYDELYKETGGFLSSDDYDKIIVLAEKKSQEKVSIDENSVCVDKKYPVQYAKKDGNGYVLVSSEMMQGVKCKLKLDVIPAVGFMLNGEAEYFVPSKRSPFLPYPNLDAGHPISLMGGYFHSNLLFPGDKYAVNCCLMKSVKDGGVARATGLIVLIQGDIRSQVPPDSVVTPAEIRE